MDDVNANESVDQYDYDLLNAAGGSGQGNYEGDNNSIEIHKCSDECRGNCSPFTVEENAQRGLAKLQLFYNYGEFCDCTVRTDDGSSFLVHRIILCGHSDYFRTLFTTTLYSKPKSDVRLHSVSSETMRNIFDYMYSRKIFLCEESIAEILETADFLGIVGLKSACCQYIEKHIDTLNCISLRDFSRHWFCEDLFRKCQLEIMRNFVQVSQRSDELLDLEINDVIHIFGNDELNVKNEELVWEASLRWINRKPEQRKKHVVELLTQVRTGLMETQYFMEHVKDHPFVHGQEEARPIVIETLRFLYDLEVITERDGEIPTPNIARPRIPHEVLFAIGGWSGGAPTSYIETYDTRADRWIRVEEVDSAGPRAYHGTISIEHEIYIIGGFDGVEYFNSCRAFNAITKVWREIAPMHIRRCYVSVALLGSSFIYALGGYDGHHRQNSCERYNKSENQWSHVAPMNYQRSDASASALDGNIYVVGGFNGTEVLSTAEVYSVENNQWTILPAMRNRRSGVSCVNYHNCIYVVGGFNGMSRMCSGEKYSPRTNTWTNIPDMYNPRSNFAIEVIDDMIFCIGGFNGVTTIFHVECFDGKTNEWYEATDMNIYRSALSACVIFGLPNITDYIHQHREKLMEEKRQRLLVLQHQRL